MSGSGTGQSRVKRTYFRGYGPSRAMAACVVILGLGPGCADEPIGSMEAAMAPAERGAALAPACEEQTWGENDYLFCRDRSSWHEARTACATKGYHLLSIADQEEEDWVYTQLEGEPRVVRGPERGSDSAVEHPRGHGPGRTPDDPRFQWWMGFNDLEDEGDWGWEDGSAVTYVNWHREDKRKDLKGKDCARLRRFYPAHGWYDAPCQVKAHYICERDGVIRSWLRDADGDGFGDPETEILAVHAPSGYVSAEPGSDCDDSNAGIHPGAEERCDGVDNDCDGHVDLDPVDPSTWYADGDADGYGDPTRTAQACEAPVGFVANAEDCDDSAAGVSPAQSERCDGVDNDCDGSTDEDEAIDAVTWYADGDGDGYGDAGSSTLACSCPAGFVGNDDDCDDGAASEAPMGPELCDGVDNDCDGEIDEDDAIDAARWWRDADGDGWGDPDISALSCFEIPDYVHNDDDCDDSRAESHPAAPELCDDLDNDCDGVVDDAPIDSLAWYHDGDRDGYGTSSDWRASCEQPEGYVLLDGDCDDGLAAVNPEASERCNGRDDDCDGAVDLEPIDGQRYHLDADGDGYGSSETSTLACALPAGYAVRATDCDDADPAVSPAADERCNGVDDDCDGTVDDSPVDAPIWYADADGDGWGSERSDRVACDQPSGHVALGGDCDDTEAAVHPGSVERCNGVDDDCDGVRDEDDAVDAATWYADGDGDGYGLPSTVTAACAAPAGFADPAAGEDCDDGQASVHPGAIESCDGVDEDCDGQVDEDPGEGPLWYRDEDGDGHGDPTGPRVSCEAPEGYAPAGDDCDDGDAASWRGPAWYLDRDGDGYGDPGQITWGCTAPEGHVAEGSDCDDSQPRVHPGAAERCNGADDDCDGTADEAASDAPTWYSDADGDGYGDASAPHVGCEAETGQVADASDCDDADPATHPGADERCDGHDDDCDGVVDEPGAADAPSWYRDADADGWGNPTLSTAACSQPDGYVAGARARDCDDGDDAVHPGAEEACNGTDDDCDGAVDEDDARGASAWYLDADEDGYGNPSTAQLSCDPLPGYVANDDDCNDADAGVRPGVDERCNGVDDDCDGERDEDALDMLTWFRDEDGDGWGVEITRLACDAAEGWAPVAGDCDDAQATIAPDADERCDGVDNDCDGITDEDDAIDALAWYRDADADGWGAGAARWACAAAGGEVDRDGDCDDGRAEVNPHALERCDGVDEDCDGRIDEQALDARVWYRDGDGDGWGDAARSQVACEQPVGTSAAAGDCDDQAPTAHPGGVELCDGLDNDCDGGVDIAAVDILTWYRDADADGWGTPSDTTQACEAPSGYVAMPGDCDDSMPSGPPGDEYCDGYDNDCDGVVDEPESLDASWWYRDRDGDGSGDLETTALACYQPYEYVLDSGDCDDLDPARFHGNTEICDGVDNDCDEEIDEDAVGRVSWYEDGDRDGYGDPASASLACDAPEGWITEGGDCDDDDGTRHPGATERCNGADDDCDAVVDEDAIDATSWYLDADLDGHGVPETTAQACEQAEGWAPLADDCDDSAAGVFPGATELCDGLDNDCDGVADEDDAADAPRWYEDRDGDGFGDASTARNGCTRPLGWTDQTGDCDDGDAGIHPAALELCNLLDDDCDAWVDEGAVDAAWWYLDADGDSFGDPEVHERACAQPEGWVADASDCDDSDGAVSPSAQERCNGADDDCDAVVDEDAIDGRTWYLDDDADGWGRTDATRYACQRPDGYASKDGDCDDAVAIAYPGAREQCDGLDNDCDGALDEADAEDARRWYPDGDGDGYGLAGTSELACDAPEGWVSNRADCDDANPWVHPEATELCNGIDDDCDEVVDLDSAEIISQWADADGDGWGARGEALQACELLPGHVTTKGDCDDAAATIHPGADERCNDRDDDCDSLVDEDDAVDTRTWYRDRDRDGYGDLATPQMSCSQPDGYVSNDLDCDDRDLGVHPGALDLCKDGVDNDCDGETDDCLGWPEQGALSAAEVKLIGESSASKAGNALASLGDTDGDGLGELLVGAWMEDSAERNAGAVYVVDGPLWGEVGLGSARAKLTGEAASDGAGYALDAAGDVNGDGAVDLLIGAKGYDGHGSAAGIAYLVLGPVEGELSLAAADTRLLGLAEDDNAGAALAGVGDVNGDGRDDLLIGAPGDSSAGDRAGAAYLFYGAAAGSSALSEADARLFGGHLKDYAGAAVASLGDHDGDGFADLAVGAWGYDTNGAASGAVHVVLGPVYGDVDLARADATVVGAARGDKLGSALAEAGDLDGDGYGDLLVGAEGEDSGGDLAGAAYLFYGPVLDGVSASEADLSIIGAGRDERAGASLSVAGDIDGDGWTDLAIGAPGSSVGGSASGAAYLISGTGEGTVDLATDALCFAGAASLDNAGLAIAGPGDMTGDGLDDLAVGAEGSALGGTGSGAVYLISGMLGSF